MKKYAELMLYMGRCDNHGFGEGKFDENARDKYSRERYISVIQYVRREIDRVARREEHAFLDYGYFRVVKDEIEARRLIEYVKEHIPEAEEAIELVDSMHGKIRFLRKIRFGGASKKDRQRLIDIINKSGMGPIKDPEEYGADYCWERVLKFH